MSFRKGFAILVAGVAVAATMSMPASATFSGPTGRITFARERPDFSGLEVFSAKPDGSDEQQLTFSGEGRTSFFSDWSPDGSQIAFDSDRIDQDGLDDVVQIYVMPWNGEAFGLTQLTVGPGFHGDPGWAPSGEEIAIEADWGDFPALEGIWIVPSFDSTGVSQADARRVTTTPAGALFDSEPQYSPDGQWIAFTRFRSCRFGRGHLAESPHGCKSAIFRVHPDGTGLQQLTPWGLEASAPDWSPDGTKIVFDVCDTGRPGCRGDIYVMNPDGSDRTRLTDYPPVSNAGQDFENFRFDFANNPVWSPDGTKIMYTEFRPGFFWLVTIDPDGSDRTVVVDGDFFQNKADWGTHP